MLFILFILFIYSEVKDNTLKGKMYKEYIDIAWYELISFISWIDIW